MAGDQRQRRQRRQRLPPQCHHRRNRRPQRDDDQRRGLPDLRAFQRLRGGGEQGKRKARTLNGGGQQLRRAADPRLGLVRIAVPVEENRNHHPLALAQIGAGAFVIRRFHRFSRRGLLPKPNSF